MALNPAGPYVTLRWMCPLQERVTDMDPRHTPSSQTAPGHSHCAGPGHGLCVNTQTGPESGPHHTAESKVVLAPSGEHRPRRRWLSAQQPETPGL